MGTAKAVGARPRPLGCGQGGGGAAKAVGARMLCIRIGSTTPVPLRVQHYNPTDITSVE